MDATAQVLFSGSLTFGVPLALAVYELMTMRRDRPGPGRPRDVPERQPKPLPPGLRPVLPPLPPFLSPGLPRDLAREDALDSPMRRRVLEPI